MDNILRGLSKVRYGALRSDHEKADFCPSAENDWNSSAFVTEEFPYQLTCKKSQLFQFLAKQHLFNCDTGKQQNNTTVALVYHVGMVNNWQTIVKDQVTALMECGLFDIASEMIISYSNGDEQSLRNATQSLQLQNKPLTFIKATSAPWEREAMNSIHQYCNQQLSPQNAVVFYFHNKGASHWSSDWKSKMNQVWTYSRTLYWRKYMEYFLLEHPHLCLGELLLNGARTCGVNWHTNHHSGNFWSASCEHVQQLNPMSINDTNHVAAEMWVGAYENLFHEQERHISLYKTAKKLYEELILPDEYALSNEMLMNKSLESNAI